ncbi:Hypothetical protein mma_2219 [Janthinobacterium sp. Marseille]|nr:helix-turn-helix transcriptional regulator [Janthinobacterium sp. Marseille]ABR91897.1 Hypothetical protein mma_2219 [Janthinobacterium sp. Marseille]
MKQTWKQRLTEARLNRNLSKTEFAAAVSVSAPTVTDWEKPFQDGGIAEMKGNNLTKVCEVLGITAEWLLNGSGKLDVSKRALSLVAKESPSSNEGSASADDYIELLALFQQSSTDGKSFILDSARNAEKATGARWKKVVNKG